jgi:ATP-dependent Clp protease protease subunit
MKLGRESIDRFFDHNLHLESRTLFVGGGDNEINAVAAEEVIKAFHLLGSTPDKPITVLLNSFGGCWFNGMAIYDTIKSCQCTVTGIVIGSAMSMGSIILQACDERIIYPNATVMIHDGYESMSDVLPKTFQNWAEYSKKTRQQMYRIYSERSGKPPSFWKKKCAADMILSAQEAKAIGLVDKVFGVE